MGLLLSVFPSLQFPRGTLRVLLTQFLQRKAKEESKTKTNKQTKVHQHSDPGVYLGKQKHHRLSYEKLGTEKVNKKNGGGTDAALQE